MIQFKVSVPGNLSLFGEHAIEYGRAGLMGSIDLRTTLTFEEISNSDIIFYVAYNDSRYKLNVPLEKFVNFYNNCAQDIESLNGVLLQCFANVYKSHNHKMIVNAFFYLLTYIAYKEQIEIKVFEMQLSTEFMVDNEFACSAPIAICLATCFLNWSRLQKGVTDTLDEANMEKIQSYATHYEVVSSQSGIVDVFTCLHGSLTKYKNGRVTRILSMPSMPILLVDSKEQKQLLNIQEQQVAELVYTMPRLVQSTFKSIDILTQCAYYAFEKIVDISKNDNLDPVSRFSYTGTAIKALETYARLNQNLLKRINVFLPHVDNICSTAQMYEMCGICADNGRFVCIWCPEHGLGEPCALMKLLTDELTTQGFHMTETKFAHEGVKIEPW